MEVSVEVSVEASVEASVEVSVEISVEASLDSSNVKGSRWKFRWKFRWKDVVFQAYYSPLLVLVCRSVSQDPPRPIEDITVAFGLLYSLSTALSQSAVSYAHAAPGRPISDRLSPLFYRLFHRSPYVSIY